MSARMPNFLFIGPDRTGSTWLHQVLGQHPQVFVPKLKDSYFFNRYHHLGLPWYAGLFRDARPEHLAVGEVAHDYLYSDKARTRIRQQLPQVKLLITIRDPVDRAVSHWRFRRRSGATDLGFEDDLQSCPEICEHGLYAKALRNWMRDFPPEQIHFLSFEKLRSAPRRFCGDLATILQIDDALFPKVLPPAVQRAKLPRSSRVIRVTRLIGDRLRDHGFARTWGHMKSSAIAQKILFQSRNVPRPVTCPGAFERIFDEDRKQLEHMTGQSWSSLAGPGV